MCTIGSGGEGLGGWLIGLISSSDSDGSQLRQLHGLCCTLPGLLMRRSMMPSAACQRGRWNKRRNKLQRNSHNQRQRHRPE